MSCHTLLAGFKVLHQGHFVNIASGNAWKLVPFADELSADDGPIGALFRRLRIKRIGHGV